MGPNGGFNIQKSPWMWQHMNRLKLDQFIMIGDVYYSDINTNNATADYTQGAWRNPANDAAATLAAFRTNCISTFSEFQNRKYTNWSATFRNNTPGAFMLDDHDRGWNDMDGVATWNASQITRAANAREAADELFMDLNAPYITAEGRPWVHGSTAETYFVIDVHPVRIIVMDCRSFRDLRTTPDTASKSMLGPTQKAWVKARILDNPSPYLVLANPIQFDGYHGWNESTNDGWSAYSYERDEILDYIRVHGNPQKTVVVSGDTHAGSVEVYRDTAGDIWEFLSGDFWPDSYHGYINGWSLGADGRGGTLIKMRVNEPNFCLIEVSPESMVVSLQETVQCRTVFTKIF
jgi:phosphodiesterase/alkaline phosphatase D-like protein